MSRLFWVPLGFLCWSLAVLLESLHLHVYPPKVLTPVFLRAMECWLRFAGAVEFADYIQRERSKEGSKR